MQAYEGVVIAKRNRGLNSSFVVRKISSGEGVERTFQTYSPLLASIEVKRRGDVRRAKLYYLRDRSGKSARIREKLGREGARRPSDRPHGRCRRSDRRRDAKGQPAGCPLSSARALRFAGQRPGRAPTGALRCITCLGWRFPRKLPGTSPLALPTSRCEPPSTKPSAFRRNASDDEVRAALRGQIRKYYAKTRDGQGNVEEALRFINHASRILSDPSGARSTTTSSRSPTGTVDERIAHVVEHRRRPGRQRSHRRSGAARRGVDAADVRETAARRRPTPRRSASPHHPGLTERVALGRASPTAVTVRCARCSARSSRRRSRWSRPRMRCRSAKQVLVWLTLLLLALTVVYGVVHGIAWTQRRRDVAAPALDAADRPRDPQLAPARRACSSAPTSRRRTRAGSSSCAWPSSSARSSAAPASRARGTASPRACSTTRSGASSSRVPLSELRSARRRLAGDVAYWLGHPLVAPMLITAIVGSDRGAADRLDAARRPGKWLFGVYLQFSISDAYASRDACTQFRRALRARRCASGGRAWAAGFRCSRRS